MNTRTRENTSMLDAQDKAATLIEALPWIQRFAGTTMVIASGKPYLSTARWILMPLIFLPPSKPRVKQVGAD